jgi:hypothetical protein
MNTRSSTISVITTQTIVTTTTTADDGFGQDGSFTNFDNSFGDFGN